MNPSHRYHKAKYPDYRYQLTLFAKCVRAGMGIHADDKTVVICNDGPHDIASIGWCRAGTGPG